jgi:NNP family nitrate/nitrite transporter-like MFS transporter
MRGGSSENMPSDSQVTGPASSPTRALVLATISFTLSFAAWGLIGGLASVFTGLYRLTASQTALLVAVPVLLGSLARLPMGMLTDRFGGRFVFTALLAFSSLAAFVVPLTGSYGSLLVAAFLIGMAGSSFAVGAAFVSRWTPAARQGTGLGIYGLGTMGQSLAVFVGPVVAARLTNTNPVCWCG